MQVYYNKRLYDLPAIKKAIKAFSPVKFKIKEDKKYFLIKIEKGEQADPNFADEFSNYVLSSVKN